MEKRRWGSVREAANRVVTSKEQKDAARLIQNLEIAKGLGAEGWQLLEREAREEIARLNPNEKFDHEEVFAGVGRYTSGRKKYPIPNLDKIKGNKWLEKGE